MRPIDADALMQTLGITDMDCAKCKWYSRAYRQCKRGGDFEDACTAIEDAPTIEPQRMRGRWIEDGYNDEKAVCDQCGEPCATYIMGEPRDKYCKWCGADMRGEQDEVD